MHLDESVSIRVNGAEQILFVLYAPFNFHTTAFILQSHSSHHEQQRGR